MRTIIIKTLIIDRKKWHRGTSSLLLSKDGMCCLGFDCINEGFSESDIMNVGSPTSLGVKIKGISFKRKTWMATNTCGELMETNDDEEIYEEKRENKITSLFKKIGREVKFIN